MRDSLEEFLASVELRAFRLARYRLDHQEDAHDVVQDAMERFVKHYSERPQEEWPNLFYGILHNRIRDLQRHGQVRKRTLYDTGSEDDEAGRHPLDRASAPEATRPDAEAGADATITRLAQAIGTLPERQREAVTLRIIQEMDVAETAAAMACSEGSVKTHLSRGLRVLREMLGDER
jgi:RNA polymerase sigma-70 factor (ECF subfamily)